MERKYQLVAWTENITDAESGRLSMIPSLECEIQATLITDLTLIHQEEYKFSGPVSLDLARRAVLTYENISRFEIFTGHYGDGIRYLFFAAHYCIREELRDEFVRLCEEAIALVKKYRREDILMECKPEYALSLLRDYSIEDQVSTL